MVRTHKGIALLVIQLRVFQKWHRWNAFKISCYQNPGTFSYPILLCHPGLLNPCCWFQGREGNSVLNLCVYTRQEARVGAAAPMLSPPTDHPGVSPLLPQQHRRDTFAFSIVSFHQTFLLPRKRQALDLMCLVGSSQYTDRQWGHVKSDSAKCQGNPL